MLHKCLTVALFLFSFTSVHAQEITLGSSVFLNSTSFDFEGNSNANSQLATAQNTIEIGLTYDLSDVISVDVAFHGLPTDLSSATAADATNEVSVTYVGA